LLPANISFRLISRDIDKSLARVAEKPEVSREAQYYLTNITKVKSVDDLLKDDRLYRFAMTAFGMKDMIYAKAFIRKVLTEGIDDQKSFALQLADPRFREFAEAFNFNRYGGTTTVFDRTQQGTVDRYVRLSLEEEAGNENEGVRLALYFERKAGSLRSAFSILADPAMLKVAQVALGISPSVGATDIEKQAKLLNDKLNIEDLKDPAKLQKFLGRFTSLWEINNPSSVQNVPNILLNQPLASTMSPDTLMKLQSFKPGKTR
jgi:Protein of unknown function (DUF1217)